MFEFVSASCAVTTGTSVVRIPAMVVVSVTPRSVTSADSPGARFTVALVTVGSVSVGSVKLVVVALSTGGAATLVTGTFCVSRASWQLTLVGVW